ncbi:MAG: nucleoside 2-deoxyribosyltransferase [Hyphomicrobiaceae bacterium]|nr:nucleoside 2-deoxyribosyltransferase [Hyphomicrobiaceae bacterium]
MPAFRIYLAGPEVFLPDFGADVFAAKKAACRAAGFEGVSPMDGDLDLAGLAPFAQGIAIYRGNLAHMAGCDAVIANMTPFRGVSMDAGTAFEMGYMAASGKPVLGYTHVATPFAERCEHFYAGGGADACESYSASTAIERFDMADNLMMVGAVDLAGFRVRHVTVAAGEELSSLAGFECCLADLAAARRR